MLERAIYINNNNHFIIIVSAIERCGFFLFCILSKVFYFHQLSSWVGHPISGSLDKPWSHTGVFLSHLRYLLSLLSRAQGSAFPLLVDLHNKPHLSVGLRADVYTSYDTKYNITFCNMPNRLLAGLTNQATT